MTLVAIDIGGSGSRITATDDAGTFAVGPALTVAHGRADHSAIVGSLAQSLGPQPPVIAVAVGAAGLIAHGDPDAIAAAVGSAWPGAIVVVASDAVTATVGAWGESGGAIVAAGTGVVAFATDLKTVWLRADGWGHVLGDDGGAAWIGGRGLGAALRALDGRPRGSSVLLDALREQFGDPLQMPALLRSAANPATLLATFAPAVTGAATAGDPVARELVDSAAVELADAGVSVVRDGISPRLALVGGLAEEPLIAAGFAARVRECLPEVEVVTGEGSPLKGALHLARLAAEGRAPADYPPYVTVFSPSTHSHTRGES